MRKYLYKVARITTIFLILTSCEDFLKEDPRNLLSPANFFNSDAEAMAAVNGLYFGLMDGNLYRNRGVDDFYINGADVIGPSRKFGGVEPIQSYTITEANYGSARGAWQGLYRIVQDANLILEKITDNPNLSEAGRQEAMGQTLFLRSLAYYHLTNLWGDVPYYRENTGLTEVKALGRTDVEQIRNDLVEDLLQAETFLPPSYSGSNLGKATKSSARTLLVKVYLIMKNWQAARDKAVEIINTSPHRLLDNYADVFDRSNPYNDEIIFQVDFVKDLLTTTRTDSYSPRIRDEPAKSSERAALTAALEARNEGFTGYGLAIPLPDFQEKFPLDDLRRPMNIITEYLGFKLKFPYMPKNWNLDQINSPRGNHDENFIVFRLADVYLMAAEAENELSGPDLAYQYINKVRERAYEPDKPLSGLSQEQFRQAIYDERKWELAGEGHRRLDLIRWGILLDVVKSTEYRVYDPASFIKPHHVLLPIPVEELELNPKLLESDPSNNGYRAM
jgi:hypothetical protein